MLEDAKANQNIFRLDLAEIKKGNPKKKSDEEKKALYNINVLCKTRETVVKFYADYSSMMFESLYKSTEGERLKILTPKQMLQRLPVALAEIKAGNNSEHLLNEIRQIVYSLCQSKQITKNV